MCFELGDIPEREMQKYRDEAETLGKGSFAFAFFMDRQKEERLRGVTIQCTTKEFFTDSKHYTIIDSPGHRDYIKNMVTGSSQADVALLMIPASNFAVSIAKGNHKTGEVAGQSRQHSLLCNLLGVKQLIVGVNKMDTQDWSKERYDEISAEVRNVLARTGWKKQFIKDSVPIIPMAGYLGDNILTKSDNMSWWKGQEVKTISGRKVQVTTLMDALDKMVERPERDHSSPLRAPISGVYSIKGVGSVLTSRIEQGIVAPGMEVKFLPTHTEANPCTGKVFTVEMHHKNIDSAEPGHNVGMNVKGLPKNMPRTGDVMVLKNDTSLGICKSFTAQVQILQHPGELKVGYCPIAFVRTGRSPIRLTAINWKMGKSTGGAKVENPKFIKSNEVAELVFEPMQPFVVDAFKSCEGLGRVAIMEGNGPVAIGKVIKVEFKK